MSFFVAYISCLPNAIALLMVLWFASLLQQAWVS